LSPGLDIVCRSVEVLADVGHQARGEVSEGPVIVDLFDKNFGPTCLWN